MAKRGVSQRALDPKPVEAAGGNTVRQLILVKQGIEIETAKKMVKALKDSKIKVQAQIQGDELRVTGKNRDDLQSAIALASGAATTGSTCSSSTSATEVTTSAAGPGAAWRAGERRRYSTYSQ